MLPNSTGVGVSGRWILLSRSAVLTGRQRQEECWFSPANCRRFFRLFFSKEKRTLIEILKFFLFRNAEKASPSSLRNNKYTQCSSPQCETVLNPFRSRELSTKFNGHYLGVLQLKVSQSRPIFRQVDLLAWRLASTVKLLVAKHPKMSFEFCNNKHTHTVKPASTNQSVATANDWLQHAASCHKLAAITIKVGAQLRDGFFFTLFGREEPSFPMSFPLWSWVSFWCIFSTWFICFFHSGKIYWFSKKFKFLLFDPQLQASVCLTSSNCIHQCNPDIRRVGNKKLVFLLMCTFSSTRFVWSCLVGQPMRFQPHSLECTHLKWTFPHWSSFVRRRGKKQAMLELSTSSPKVKQLRYFCMHLQQLADMHFWSRQHMSGGNLFSINMKQTNNKQTQYVVWGGWRTILTSRAWSLRKVSNWHKSEVEFIQKMEQKRFGVYAIVSLCTNWRWRRRRNVFARFFEQTQLHFCVVWKLFLTACGSSCVQRKVFWKNRDLGYQ